MNPCLRERLVQTIGVGSITGYTVSGTPIAATVRDVKAYVEVKTAFSTGPGGSDKNTTHVLITEEAIKLDDDIYLPGVARTSANRRKPASVDAFYDPFTGAVDHYEVKL